MKEFKSIWNSKAEIWAKQAEDTNNYFTKRTNFVVELVTKNIEQGDALDVGCGAGLLSYRLAEKEFRVYATDISEKLILKTFKRFSTKFNLNDGCFRVCQRGEIPFKEKSFDVITAIGVFPYIENYELYIKKLSRFIKPNGYIVASCTNRRSIFVFLDILRRILSFRFTNNWWTTLLNLIRTGIWSGGHVEYRKAEQAYSSSHFDKLFYKNGFKKVDEFDLYNIPFLDRHPLDRKGLSKVFARYLGWNHIGVYQKTIGAVI